MTEALSSNLDQWESLVQAGHVSPRFWEMTIVTHWGWVERKVFLLKFIRMTKHSCLLKQKIRIYATGAYIAQYFLNSIFSIQ